MTGATCERPPVRHQEDWLPMQLQLTTSPLFGDPRLPARFWSKVRVLDNGCWEWTACQFEGYGRFGVGSRTDGTQRTVYAHRWAYENLIGPFLQGLEPDHLCRFPPCVNPAHIEPVTRRENLLRGDNWESRKTHCPQGHPYNAANTRHYRGRRYCRTCNREAERRDRRMASGVR